MSPQATDGPEAWWIEVEERLFGHVASAHSSHGRILSMRGMVGAYLHPAFRWGLTERSAMRRARRYLRRTLRRRKLASEREMNASVYPVE